MEINNEYSFVRLDADNIGDDIELALVNDDIDLANNIHKKIQKGILMLIQQLEENSEVKILMTGCDDILFKIKQSKFNKDDLIELKNIFLDNTGYTLSIGVGCDLKTALFNMRKAKLQGKNTIVTEF
jgi:hypothetical protein